MSKIITNQFAEDLGYTYGGCIRDLVRFTAREAARVSKAKLPLFDFLNPGPYDMFNGRWSALLQATAIRTTLDNCPEYQENEKLVKKTLFQMNYHGEEVMADKIFKRLSDEQINRYEDAKQKLIAKAIKPDTVKSELADLFLEILHGAGSDRINEKTRAAVLKQITLSSETFRRLIDKEKSISNKSGCSIEKLCLKKALRNNFCFGAFFYLVFEFKAC